MAYINVAVVEDDDDLRALITEVVRERGHEVTSFATGEAAWLSFQATPCALLLIDRTLPGMDGLELCRRVRELSWGREAVILVLTAHAGPASLAAALDAGADDFLAKPFDLDLLDVRLIIAERQSALLHARHVAETALHASEARFRALTEHATDLVAVIAADGIIRYASPSYDRVLGYTADEMVGQSVLRDVHPDDVARVEELLTILIQPAFATETICSAEFRLRHRDGSWRQAEMLAINRLADPAVRGIIATTRDITARKQGESELRRSQESYRRMVATMQDGIWHVDPAGITTFVNTRMAELLGYTVDEMLGRHFSIFMDEQGRALIGTYLSTHSTPPTEPHRDSNSRFDVLFQRKDSSGLWAVVSINSLFDEQGEYTGSWALVTDITERVLAEEQLRFQAHLLNTVGQAVAATNLQGTITYWNHAAELLYGWTATEAIGRSIAEVMPAGNATDYAAEIFAHLAAGQSWSGEQVHRHREGRTFPALITATPVFDMQGRVIGSVGISADITVQKDTQARITRHLEQLSALRTIDMTITAGLDLSITLGIIVQQVISQLGVDAAVVLRLDPHLQTLEYAAGLGFRGSGVRQVRLRLGEGHAGQAALERSRQVALDLRRAPLSQAYLVADEAFVSAIAVPLITKGEVQGVLEVFHRSALDPDREWTDFLEALAGQTAIAIADSMLFTELQRTNMELALAYDTTIEGWSRALDLRDKETDGHSHRVTEMTVRLAELMGIPRDELVHVRRGTLLHDIGKMGIPDSILLKPAPLNEEEWRIMRQHPTFAYELLRPIPHLRPALDIPYRHHEKWDGSGYPHGLTGEQIPLAARVFAVVDVWDALTTDRPYRQAWPVDRVRTHIESLAGSHFDPAVVDVFLHFIDGKYGQCGQPPQQHPS